MSLVVVGAVELLVFVVGASSVLLSYIWPLSSSFCSSSSSADLSTDILIW